MKCQHAVINQTQENDLVKAMQSSRLPARGFRWSYHGNGPTPFDTVLYKGKGKSWSFRICYFVEFVCTYRPASDIPENTVREYEWSQVLRYFKEWLRAVRDQEEAPDLWDQFVGAATSASATLPTLALESRGLVRPLKPSDLTSLHQAIADITKTVQASTQEVRDVLTMLQIGLNSTFQAASDAHLEARAARTQGGQIAEGLARVEDAGQDQSLFALVTYVLGMLVALVPLLSPELAVVVRTTLQEWFRSLTD